MHHTGNNSSETWVREYWTLVMRDGRWTLGSIEQDREGEHQLTAPLVAEAGDDVAGLRDETVVEQAVADRVPNGDFAALTPLTSRRTPRRRPGRWPWSTSASSRT